jgi:hypothetical protein
VYSRLGCGILAADWNVKMCSKNLKGELKYSVDFLSAYLMRVSKYDTMDAVVTVTSLPDCRTSVSQRSSVNPDKCIRDGSGGDVIMYSNAVDGRSATEPCHTSQVKLEY